MNFSTHFNTRFIAVTFVGGTNGFLAPSLGNPGGTSVKNVLSFRNITWDGPTSNNGWFFYIGGNEVINNINLSMSYCMPIGNSQFNGYHI